MAKTAKRLQNDGENVASKLTPAVDDKVRLISSEASKEPKRVYVVVSMSKENAIVTEIETICGKSCDTKEQLVSLHEIEVIFPIEVGRRYIFTPRPNKDGEFMLSGIWVVSAIKEDRSFELSHGKLNAQACTGRLVSRKEIMQKGGSQKALHKRTAWFLDDFVDITPIDNASII
jgi:hypothetical protein